MLSRDLQLVARPPYKVTSICFILYITVIIVCACILTKSSYLLSRQFDVGGKNAGTIHLYKGWIPGYKNDLSDIQWRQYRESMPMLIAALSIFVLISRRARHRSNKTQHAYQLASGIILIFALHGASALHVLSILVTYYFVVKRTAGTKWVGPLAIWSCPCAVWLLARAYNGLPFSMLGQGFAVLDRYGGMMRWHITFNLVLLRMISWGCDLHWSRLRLSGHPVGFETNAPAYAYKDVPNQFPTLQPKERQMVNHSKTWYTLDMMLRYCLYPPLYLTGPTITFNDFVCQARCAKRWQVKELVRFALRIALTMLIIELMTHTLYINAFMRFKMWAHAKGTGFDAVAMAALSFYKLIFLWLKFVIIWRVSRFFALADGIDPPENMLRCICNNYDISGFWRNWHASYNKWLVRYMYIPMGGSKNRLLVVWPIFTFVAVWHDLEWHLLRWAWLMALFIAPEVICKAIISRPAWKKHWQTAWFNHLCAAFAAVYITILMAINLVGYGMGQGGVVHLLKEVLGSWPLTGAMLLSFFSAAHLMFELRRREGSVSASQQTRS